MKQNPDEGKKQLKVLRFNFNNNKLVTSCVTAQVSKITEVLPSQRHQAFTSDPNGSRTAYNLPEGGILQAF